MSFSTVSSFYYWMHRVISKPQERGEYSSGLWQDKVRGEALALCRDAKGRLLEVGCGEGLFLTELALANKNTEIYGIDNWGDILGKAYKRLKEKNIENVRLLWADAASLVFEDSYFDTVVCINVIFNLESIDIVKKVLNEISRVSRKGGRVILDFRNKENIFLYLKYKFAPYYDQTVRGLPLKTYTLEDMKILLDRAGLKIKRKISVGFPKLLPPIIILEAEKT